MKGWASLTVWLFNLWKLMQNHHHGHGPGALRGANNALLEHLLNLMLLFGSDVGVLSPVGHTARGLVGTSDAIVCLGEHVLELDEKRDEGVSLVLRQVTRDLREHAFCWLGLLPPSRYIHWARPRFGHG